MVFPIVETFTLCLCVIFLIKIIIGKGSPNKIIIKKIHEFIKNLTNVILCQNSLVCHKHKFLLTCHHTTNP